MLSSSLNLPTKPHGPLVGIVLALVTGALVVGVSEVVGATLSDAVADVGALVTDVGGALGTTIGGADELGGGAWNAGGSTA